MFEDLVANGSKDAGSVIVGKSEYRLDVIVERKGQVSSEPDEQ